jgi:hypothetical protein
MNIIDEQVVSLDAEHRVRFWSEALRATPDQIRDAMRAVGTSPEAVRRYLTSRKTAAQGH